MITSSSASGIAMIAYRVYADRPGVKGFSTRPMKHPLCTFLSIVVLLQRVWVENSVAWRDLFFRCIAGAF